MRSSIIFVAALVAALSITFESLAQSSVKIRTGAAKRAEEADNSLSIRAQALYDKQELSPADMPWMRVIYRSIDLKQDANLPLYFPEESMEGQENLFRLIMRLLSDKKVEAFEYLDGREIFTDEYKIKVSEMLERFHILYSEKESGGKSPRIVIDPSDVPANEVLSYYVREKWMFDQRNSGVTCEIEALCPVLHRVDDFGGEPIRYPMFWIKYSDLRPYMAQQYILTSSENNVRNYTIDDFFRLRMFEGEIYKTMNLRNMSLMQLYPEPAAQDSARAAIEKQLESFEKGLWIDLQQESVAAKKGGDSDGKPVAKADASEPASADVKGNATEKDEPKSSVRSSRGSSDNVKSSSSSRSKTPRTKAPKASKTQAPVRSVRSTK